MQIGSSDVVIIKKWIEVHWKGEPLCPVCKSNNWSVGNTIAELRPFLRGKLKIGGLIYPVVLFTCNVCGHTLFFNAIKLGIVEFPPPKDGAGVVTPPKEVTSPKEKEGDGND